MSFYNFQSAGLKQDDGSVQDVDLSNLTPDVDAMLGGLFKDKNVEKQSTNDPLLEQVSKAKVFQPQPEVQNKIPQAPTSLLPDMQHSIGGKIDRQLGTTGVNKQYNNILDLISEKESHNNFNIIQGGKEDKSLTSSTILQLSNKYQSKALGGYQIQMPTAIGALEKVGINPSTFKFDYAGQKYIANLLLKNRIGKQTDPEKIAHSLSKEWAVLPKDAGGKSYYEGIQGNKALTDWATVINTLKRTS